MNMNYIAMAAIALVSLTACGSNVVKPNTDHTVQAHTIETAPDWYMSKDTGNVGAQIDALIKQYKLDIGTAILENTEQIVRNNES